MKINTISARSILDSRGFPTVEATVVTEAGAFVAGVPSGTSTGSHEAVELRDGDRRWGGQGVSKAVSHVNVELAGALKGKDVTDQAGVDQVMRDLDNTPDKSRLGANALLAVSLACLQAGAAAKKQPLWKHLGKSVSRSEPVQLPLPLCNVINGGAHADNSLAIQEFMLVPHGFKTFAEALRAATETFHALRGLLKSRGQATSVGAEGGFAPDFESHTAALSVLVEAIEAAGYKPADQISLALDVAASEFREESGAYIFEGHPLSAEQLAAQYASLAETYPIVSIEDPLGEDDWDGWEAVTRRLDGKVQLVGDDLTVTNVERIGQAIERGVISAAILKPNQIGTYSETEAAWRRLTQSGLAAILSHRSGETLDTTIVDMAVGWGAPQLKAGSLSRGERVAKYNRLLAIERELGGSAVYVGKGGLNTLKTTN